MSCEATLTTLATLATLHLSLQHSNTLDFPSLQDGRVNELWRIHVVVYRLCCSENGPDHHNYASQRPLEVGVYRKNIFFLVGNI